MGIHVKVCKTMRLNELQNDSDIMSVDVEESKQLLKDDPSRKYKQVKNSKNLENE